MDGIDGIVQVIEALGQQNRIRILMMLRDHELSVTKITQVLRTRVRKIDLSTVSRHLGHLRRVGLLESRRDGARILYRRASLRGDRALKQLVDLVERWVRGDAQVAKDLEAVKKLRRRDAR